MIFVSCYDTLYRMDEQVLGSNIRRLRTQKGMTLTAVAKKAELTKSTLSKIETGHISPPISTLMRLAKAMNVPLVGFFVDDDQRPVYVLTQKGKGRIVSRDGSRFGYAYEALALEKQDKYFDPFLLTINPCDPAGQFHHSGQEFIYMLSGQMELTIGQEHLKVKAGDALYFDSSHIHKTQVKGKWPAKFLCIFAQEIPVQYRKGKQK